MIPKTLSLWLTYFIITFFSILIISRDNQYLYHIILIIIFWFYVLIYYLWIKFYWMSSKWLKIKSLKSKIKYFLSFIIILEWNSKLLCCITIIKSININITITSTLKFIWSTSLLDYSNNWCLRLRCLYRSCVLK